MTETFNELSVIGDKITDEDRVVLLLASLPDSYNVLVTALKASTEVPSMEMVIECLLHEERKCADGESSHSKEGEKAMTVKRQNKRGPKCYGCGGFGHIKRDCPGKSEKSERKQEKGKTKKAHTAQTKKGDYQGDSDSDGVGLTDCHALSACDTQPYHWIIDSGATSHMCNDETQFTDLVLLKQPHKVTLGDEHQVEAAGCGTVMLDIELTPGKSKKCTLTNMLYVPELTFSLISVSKAADKIGRAVFTNQGCDSWMLAGRLWLQRERWAIYTTLIVGENSSQQGGRRNLLLSRYGIDGLDTWEHKA